MGAPMVARLTAAGHDVRALGRTEESRAAVTALGATAVADLASAADGADVVVVCVFTDDQVNAVVPELIAAMPTGSVLVLHTTGSPDTAAALAESAAPRGVAVLDAPVSGGDVASERLHLDEWAGLGQRKPAAALAMILRAKPENRKAVAGVMISAALTSIITGITEPIEFAFIFVAPLLYVVHVALAFVSGALTTAFDVHLGYTFSASLIDYVLGFFNQKNSWALWAIIGPAHRVFFGGDTGYTSSFAGVGDQYGPFDLTLMPVGAYHPGWPDIHMNPEEAVRAHRDMADQGLFLPIHWATFRLAPHPWSEPVERMLVAADASGVNALVPRPGERVENVSAASQNHWWRNGSAE